MTIASKRGGRSIELFLPFKHDGRWVKTITFGPVLWDHTLRVQAGEFKTLVSLMAALAECDEAVLRKIAYPDIDRVMADFVQMLPVEIRQVYAGPVRSTEPTAEAQASAAEIAEIARHLSPDDVSRASAPAETPPPPASPSEPEFGEGSKPKFEMDMPEEQRVEAEDVRSDAEQVMGVDLGA